MRERVREGREGEGGREVYCGEWDILHTPTLMMPSDAPVMITFSMSHSNNCRDTCTYTHIHIYTYTYVHTYT